MNKTRQTEGRAQVEREARKAKIKAALASDLETRSYYLTREIALRKMLRRCYDVQNCMEWR